MKTTSLPFLCGLPKGAWIVLLLAWGLSLPPAAGWSQEEFVDRTRVTAIDLIVSARGSGGSAVDELMPLELVVVEEGQRRNVVSVAPLGGGEGEEPWRLVVYVDVALSSTETIRAAAQTLALQAATLGELGTVEVWVADGEPRKLLVATSDPQQIVEALSRVFVEVAGRDRLSALRREVLEEAERLQGARAAANRRSLAELATAREGLLIQRRLDAVVSWLASDRDAGPRALLWVQDGYDFDSGLFYRRRLSGVGAVGQGPRALAESTRTAAEAISALGWVVAPVAYDTFEQATWLADTEFEKFRRRRNEESGESNDTVNLGGALGLLFGRGKKQKEPEGSLLITPVDPLKVLTQTTAGELISTAQELPEALRRLGERFRVTYQVSRPPDGRTRAVTVASSTPRVTVQAPAVVRSSIPHQVTRARVRRILDGETDSGELVVDASYRPSAEGEEGTGHGIIRARVHLGKGQSVDLLHVPVRLSVAFVDGPPGEGGVVDFSRQLLLDQDWTGEWWSRELAIDPPAGALWAVVVVEDLSTGQWGSWEVEVGAAVEED